MVKVVHKSQAAKSIMDFCHQPGSTLTSDSGAEEPWLQTDGFGSLNEVSADVHSALFANSPNAMESQWQGQQGLSNVPAMENFQRQPGDQLVTRNQNNAVHSLPNSWNFAKYQFPCDVLPRSPDNSFQNLSSINSNFHQHYCPPQTSSQRSKVAVPEITIDRLQVSSNMDTLSLNPMEESYLAIGGQKSLTSSGFLQPMFDFSGNGHRSPSPSSTEGFSSPGSMSPWEEVDMDDSMELSQPVYYSQECRDHGSISNARATQADHQRMQFPEMLWSSPASLGGDEDEFRCVLAPTPIASKNEMLIDKPASQLLYADSSLHTGLSKAKARRRRGSHARNNDEVNLIRQAKACIRCQVLRDKCGLGDICSTCLSSASNTIYNMPCFRAHLSDVELYRSCALSFPEGIPKLSLWCSKRSVRLRLYNVGFADRSQRPEMRPCLDILCRPFPVVPGIPVTRCWLRNDGERAGINLPRYAMPAAELKQTAGKLEELVEANFNTLLLELQFGRDDIIKCALAEAARHVGSCDALDGALKISIMTRLVSKSFNITSGAEALGMTPVNDPASPYHERIPIPPMLDAQIDSLLMQKMKVLRKGVLSRLKTMIMSHSKQNWFKILLTIMVLLSNVEFLYENQYDQIKRYGKTTDRLNIMMDSWEHGARNLIAHFHAICRGDVPLHMRWDNESQKEAAVSDMDLTFLVKLRNLLDSQAGKLRLLAHAGRGSPLVWMSALLLPQGSAC